MSVRTGREFLSIPGPTNIPDDVLGAMHRPAVDIYSGGLPEITHSCLNDLKGVFRTTGTTFVYAANGHGAWEAALCNTLSRGDKILVLESGRFAVGWGEMGEMLGLDVEVLPGDPRCAVDCKAVETRLREDSDQAIKAVLVVQIDTASGVVNDIPAIRNAIDRVGHEALYMVDVIASLATIPFEMDAWGVDVAVGGCQKGLMTPPGLSFNAASPRAIEAHESAGLTTFYWDWTGRQGPMHYQKYCGTPPEHHMFGLRKALDMLEAEGFEAIFLRHRLLAEATRRAVEIWGAKGALELNIVEPKARANSVTTILMEEKYIEPLLSYTSETCNVVLGIGIGDFMGKAFRIAHMGFANAPMLLGTLSAVEMGLKALGVPHGRGGVQAAIDYLAQNVPAPENEQGNARNNAQTSCC